VNRARSSDHYSYRHYADPETARTFDDRRFGGPIGDLIAAMQAQVVARFIEEAAGTIEGREIVDVGTGTGRAAVFLAHRGARITGVDASEAMLAVARHRAAAEAVRVSFQRGDARALDFADRSFEVAVSLRVLMHAPWWRECLTELCRVAARLVIVDYPSATSFALVESLARRAAHRVGVRTEPYRVFTDCAIAGAFAGCGFRVRSVHRQFVLPIAFHRAVGSRRFTLGSEGLLDRAGLLKIFGSPVSLVAERCASS
jgi:ubiquinone/menaquinone biosynthesis C-methylase UbiE